MNSKYSLVMGVIGKVVTAICGFTPALVPLPGTVGLPAWLVWIDYILVPVPVLFTGTTFVAFFFVLKERSRGHA